MLPRLQFPFARPAAWLLALLLGVAGVCAQNSNDRKARALNPAERAALNGLGSLAPEALNSISGEATPDRVRAAVEEVLGAGPLYIGERTHDRDGLAPIHRYVLDRLRRHEGSGLRMLGTLRGEVPVPVELHKLRANPAAAPSRVTVGGESLRVSPLWPNGSMPSLCPEGGIRGRLVDIGHGEWNEINGLDLSGAVVLMDFAGGRNWERALALGARAVVVLEGDRVIRDHAERLFMNTPVPMPRFYAARAVAERLRALARQGTPPEALLEGGALYENRPFTSIFAYLPPPRELPVYTVRPDDLLARIAAEQGAGVEDLRAANPGLPVGPLATGTVLKLPGGGRTYTVAANDLLKRVATAYGLTEAQLRAANPELQGDPADGQALRIPHLDGPLLLAVPIDSVSAAPHEPHGLKSAANLATALGLLDHLATTAGSTRRRGVLFAFLDAEHFGGRGSRLLAEQQLLYDGYFQERYVGQETPEKRAARYRGAEAWFRDGVALDPAIAEWLSGKWFKTRLEAVRIALAEERIAHLLKVQNPATPEAERAAAQAALSRSEQALEAMVQLRDRTLLNRTLDPGARLAALRETLADGSYGGPLAPDLRRAGLDFEAFAARLRAEFEEEETAMGAGEGNRKCIEALVALRASAEGGSYAPMFGWYLHLSPGSGALGIDESPATDFRSGERPGQTVAKKVSDRFRKVGAHAALRAGWTEEWTFLQDSDRADTLVLEEKPVPYYPEFWIPSGVALEPLRTRNDLQEATDTPRDLPAFASFENLALQIRTATLMVRVVLESAVDWPSVPRVQSPGFGRLGGRTVEFNIRSGIDAKEPVPGVLVVHPDTKREVVDSSFNTATYRGVRPAVGVLSRLSGAYRLPVETVSHNSSPSYVPNIYAYGVDRKRAVFDRLVDMGQVGTKKQTPAFNLADGLDTEKSLVMTKVYPLLFFPGTDPVGYQPIGGKKGTQQVQVVDAVLNGEPQHYAFIAPGTDFAELDVLTNLLFLPEGRRGRVLVKDQNRFNMLLVGEVDASDPDARKGRGFVVGPEDGRPNLTVPYTPLAIARQMQALAENRQADFKRFGIFDRSTATAIDRSRAKIEEAEAALAARDWQRMNGTAREAWGILVKAYPKILSLGRQAVFSAIILLALLLPAAIFLERLVLGGRGILSRLAGATALFVAGAVFMNFFHPAFKISVSPFIVMIAFVMILMSVVVLFLSYARFDVLLRRARRAGGEVEDETITLASSLKTALSMGVSNLKKRPERTLLTTLTVSALTFSIIAFVSVKGGEELFSKKVALDPDVEGIRVSPEPPPYQGVLFREFFWTALGAQFVSDLRSEFGSRYPSAARGFFIESEGGNNSNREGVNEIQVQFGTKSTILTGIMTFEPRETEFGGLQRAVTGGQWFRAADPASGTSADLFTVILPDNAAKELGITPEMLVDSEGRRLPSDRLPQVSMRKISWRVIGILDTEAADRMRDVNGKSLAMVDYLRSAYTPSAADTRARLENEPEGYHLSWKRLAIVPDAARDSVAAKLRSVAIKVPEADAEAFFHDIALRLDRAFYGVREGQYALLSNRAQQSVGGIAKVLLPVILCVLIVANTMMGTIEERKGEVGMLGAIGLSPSQISFLLLSESTVFSVLGILFGIFGGFLFANMVPWIHAQFGLFGGLSFNFTSIASLVLAMGAGVVVLVATLIPAVRAAALAAPSGMAKWKLPSANERGEIHFRLPFTLTGANAVGVFAFLRRFLLNHADATSADFNCRGVAVVPPTAEEPDLGMRTEMWLAPYDLDVAQRMVLRFVPTDNQGVFGVDLNLHRLSGSEEPWFRTNYGFLDLLRLQFLLWRNLDPASRQRYIDEGRALLAAGGAPAASAVTPTPHA